jgi:hypothetical protein
MTLKIAADFSLILSRTDVPGKRESPLVGVFDSGGRAYSNPNGGNVHGTVIGRKWR